MFGQRQKPETRFMTEDGLRPALRERRGCNRVQSAGEFLARLEDAREL